MGRLSLGALGLSLVLLVSAAWGTGVFYVLARLGTGSPVGLASLDGIHVYVGLAGGVFVLAKVSRVGVGYRVDGVPGVVAWQRWMSWSLLALYGAVLLTGVLVLLPIPGIAYTDLVELHLLTSVWALLPTTWHVWHYRARALPYLGRWLGRAAGWRYWAGVVLVAAPVPFLLAHAPAVSQLPRVGGGAVWTPAALQGDYLDAVQRLPDGTLVAAGDALYVSTDGVLWVRVDLPVGGTPAATPAPSAAVGAAHAGHVHGAPAPPNSIVALAVTPAGHVLAGTAQGLLTSAGLTGPLQPAAAFAGGAVRALAIDPAEPTVVWAAAARGAYLSRDAGATWMRAVSGLGSPDGAAAVAWLGSDAFLSDGTGVFRWSAGNGRWARTSSQPGVSVLAAGADARLYASSATGSDVRVLAGGRWTDLGSPAPVHNHGGELHGGAGAVVQQGDVLYAAATSDGVSASDDGGHSWTQLGGGLSDVTAGQVATDGGDLLAATSGGLYRFPLAAAPSASAEWWLAVSALAVGLALVGAILGGVNQWRRSRRRPRRAALEEDQP